MKTSRILTTAIAVAAITLAGCERAGDEGEAEEAVAGDTLGWDIEATDDDDFEAEAREAGEAIQEGVEQGVEAVGAGTEELGERIQESVDEDDTTDYEGTTSER